MTEPIAEFKVKVWPDAINPKREPLYEVLLKKRFGFATYYKRISYAFNVEQVGIAIKYYKDLEKPRTP